MRKHLLKAPLLLAPVLLAIAELCLQPMRETDLFFRIQAGREILARHGLPGRNLFSFTYPDFPDIDTAWVFEVMVAKLHALGGFPAIVFAKTALLVGVFVGLWVLCRRRGVGAAATAVALLGAGLVMRDRMVERPHVLGFVWELVLLFLLTRPADATPRGWRGVLTVAVLAAVWANCHAGAFLAPLLLGASALGLWLDGRQRQQSVRKEVAWGGALTVVAAVALLATPVGTGIVRYLFVHLEITRLHPVDEFRAATLVSDPALFVLLVLLLGALLSLLVLEKRAEREWRLVLPVIAMCVLGLVSVRFAADLALCAAPWLAVRLQKALDLLAGRRPQLVAVWRRPALLGLGGVLLLAPVVDRVRELDGGAGVLDLDVDRSALPLDALAFVERHGLRERMYNDFEIGSYLAFEGYPSHRVFVDPRLPAYPLEFHRLLGRLDVSRDEWGAAMDRFGVSSALLAYAGLNRRVAWWDPERWALIYRQADARVFVRRLPRWRSLIEAREIPATFSFTVEEGAVTLPIAEPPSSSPVPRCEWHRRVGDLIFDLDGGRAGHALEWYRRALRPSGCLAPRAEAQLAGWMGALEMQRAHPDIALADLDRALELDPGDDASRTNRALVLERLGRGAEARQEWTEIARRQPDTDLGRRARDRAGTTSR